MLEPLPELEPTPPPVLELLPAVDVGPVEAPAPPADPVPAPGSEGDTPMSRLVREPQASMKKVEILKSLATRFMAFSLAAVLHIETKATFSRRVTRPKTTLAMTVRFRALRRARTLVGRAQGTRALPVRQRHGLRFAPAHETARCRRLLPAGKQGSAG